MIPQDVAESRELLRLTRCQHAWYVQSEELCERTHACVIACVAVAQHPKLHSRFRQHWCEPCKCSVSFGGEHWEDRDAQAFADGTEHRCQRVEANACSGVGEMGIAPACNCEVRKTPVET